MQQQRAAIYIRTYPFVYTIPADQLEKLSPYQVERLREPLAAAPVDVQERACRAYCERMGYSVFHVYRADTPPPEHVKRESVLRISPEPIKWLYEYDSRHPYYWVRNLLEKETIDVVVEYRDSGPSGSRWEEVPEDLAKRLGRFEYASRWEIEPPTETDLRIYELVEAVARTDTKEERAPLLAELETLTKQAQHPSEAPPQHEDTPEPSDIGQAVKELQKARRGLSTTRRALSSASKQAPALRMPLAEVEARVEALWQDVQRLAAEAEALLPSDRAESRPTGSTG